MSSPSGVERLDRLSPEQQREVRALAERLADEAGSPPLNDETLSRLADSGLTHLVLRERGELAGYAQLDARTAELAVSAGRAAELMDAVEAADGPARRIWTHGEHSTIAPLLPARGYTRTRLLHQLRRPIDVALPEPVLPDGVTARTFAVGSDEDAWLRLNAAAFATHADQGSMTLSDLRAREAEDWFDPSGFFLATQAAQQGETLLGFHWTKVHPDGAGEVYVLGVAPAAQGMRLGGALLAIGLRHLAERGCPYVLLYVDDANSTAVRLYERFGFERYDLDAQWSVR